MPKCFKQAAYYKEWPYAVSRKWIHVGLTMTPYGRPFVTKQVICTTFSIHTGITNGFQTMRMMPWLTKQWSWNLTCLTNFPDGSGHRKDLFNTLEVKREINSYNFILEPNLMTKEVCMALARRDSFYLIFHRNAGPGNLWNISPNTAIVCAGSLNCRRNYRPENFREGSQGEAAILPLSADGIHHT